MTNSKNTRTEVEGGNGAEPDDFGPAATPELALNRTQSPLKRWVMRAGTDGKYGT